MEVGKCMRCKQYKSLCDFDFAVKRRRRNCKTCQAFVNSDEEVERRKKKACEKSSISASRGMTYVCEYLLKHPCVDCGEEDIRVLDFDHVRGEKYMDITNMRCLNLEKIQEEIDKCEVRCGNCHMIKTCNDRADYRYKIATKQVVLS